MFTWFVPPIVIPAALGAVILALALINISSLPKCNVEKGPRRCDGRQRALSAFAAGHPIVCSGGEGSAGPNSRPPA